MLPPLALAIFGTLSQVLLWRAGFFTLEREWCVAAIIAVPAIACLAVVHIAAGQIMGG